MSDQFEIMRDMLAIMRNLANGQIQLLKMIMTLAEASDNYDERLKKMAMQIEGNNEMVESLAVSIFNKKQN